VEVVPAGAGVEARGRVEAAHAVPVAEVRGRVVVAAAAHAVPVAEVRGGVAAEAACAVLVVEARGRVAAAYAGPVVEARGRAAVSASFMVETRTVSDRLRAPNFRS